MQPDWWIQYALRDERGADIRRMLRECIGFSLGDHLINRMMERFPAMDACERAPSAIQHVAELLTGNKNTGSLYRKLAGERPVALLELLALATMLELEPESLVPEKVQWLSYAVWGFCRRIEKDLISIEQAEIFVEFCLRQYATKRTRNTKADHLERNGDIAVVAKRRKVDPKTVEIAVVSVEDCFNSL